jgi:hypothetical protein
MIIFQMFRGAPPQEPVEPQPQSALAGLFDHSLRECERRKRNDISNPLTGQPVDFSEQYNPLDVRWR